MKYWKLKLSLIINYIIFAILLNSVGVVILQVINDFGVNPESASVLEAWKDLSIAIASFLLASYIPRFGYKRAMITGLSVVIIGSIMMPLFGGFAMSQMLFAMVGVSFALIKISVYSTVSLVTDNANEHASFMSILEGFFMIGVLSGFWLFGFFIDIANSSDSITWLDTYWVLAGIGAMALILLLSTELDESSIKTETDNPLQDFKDMIGLIKYAVVIFFILGAFLYVYIEQAINTWLPTFNYQVLQLPDAISVQITSIYAGALAAGRILGGYVMKKLNWFYVLQTSLIMASVLVLLVLPLTIGIEPGSITGWAEVPFAAYVLPAIGLFLAPIYPTLSSSILSALPKNRQSGMTGLIVIFSALGGTSGSMVTGFLFGRLDGQTAFYFTLVPLVLLFLILIPYRRKREQFDLNNKTAE
ncbi:MFS transporter [Rhodohalobacter mucosus]|uniref:MFS transporter n=1 Tax=Rhodohalobacter mucosus TaxID=2079485 RepID=A0A316TPT7_9BACT|nr:MFS transporter [Rhodohalobacter mucosus]PWN05828.1 MFS transporter [Rhodohalobacter mucosus]